MISSLAAASIGAIVALAGDIKPLHGDMAGSFRLRLGDYRVLFSLHDNALRIFGVRHRSQAYR